MSSSNDRGPQLIAITSAFLLINLISSGLRIFTRLRLVKWLGTDDVLILCAAATAALESVAIIIATKYGLGKHIAQQPPEWREPYAKADLTSSLAYSISAMFVKLSLLSFYLRLSPNPTFRNLTKVLFVFCAGFGVSSVMVVGLQCLPTSSLWNPEHTGHCINTPAFYFANSGLHIFTEILIYVLPLHTLWQLHLPPRQKLGLCFLMCLGAMLIFISCYRIVTIKALLNSSDPTWDLYSPILWYTIELNLAIFIACGPAFLALFRHYLPAVFGSSSNNTQSKNQNSRMKNTYPLGSIPHGMGLQSGHGLRTTVTARQNNKGGKSENSSMEMIIMESGSEGGIQKQVDVWIEKEDADQRERGSGYDDGRGKIVLGV